MEDSQENLMTQAELFQAYSEQNQLHVNKTTEMMWFQFGGSKIGRMYLESPEKPQNWKLAAKYKGEFASHFTAVFINGGAQGMNPLTPD